MAKKTKREKIIAEYRRKLQLLKQQRDVGYSYTVSAKPTQQKQTKEEITKKKDKKVSKVSKSISSFELKKLEKQKKLIAKDLRKTVLLSVFGIIIIIAFYISPLM